MASICLKLLPLRCNVMHSIFYFTHSLTQSFTQCKWTRIACSPWICWTQFTRYISLNEYFRHFTLLFNFCIRKIRKFNEQITHSQECQSYWNFWKHDFAFYTLKVERNRLHIRSLFYNVCMEYGWTLHTFQWHSIGPVKKRFWMDMKFKAKWKEIWNMRVKNTHA